MTMIDLTKNKVFLFSVILNIALFVFLMASCSETSRQKQRIDKEMYQRLEAEDKLENSAKERQVLEESIAAVRKQLEEEKVSHEMNKKALLQERLVIQGVKEELDRVVTQGGDKP